MADLVLEVYDVDDATILFEIGTAVGHANPYLQRPESLVESSVDLQQGGGRIGELQIGVIDPQAGPTKAARWFTSKLGVPIGQTGEGHSQLNGHRAKLRTAAGRTIMDGAINRVKLRDSFAGFDLSLKDIRERHRKVPVFVSAARRDATNKIVAAPTVFPRGRLEGYGKLPNHEILPAALQSLIGWTIPPAEPLTGVIGSLSTSHGIRRQIVITSTEWPSNGPFPARLVATQKMLDVADRVERLEDGRLVHGDVRVLWRTVGATSWNEVRPEFRDDGRAWGPFALAPREVVYRQQSEQGETDTVREQMQVVVSVDVTATDASPALPADGTTLEFLVAYVGEPTDAYPLVFEGTAGDFLRDLYEGEFSERSPRVRYDAAAVAALKIPVRVRESEKRDDARKVEEEVYRQLGYAPAVIDGLVTPVDTAFPGAAVVLPEITDGNAKPVPGWEHGTEAAVTEVVVTYHRDFKVRPDHDPRGENSAGDGLGSKEVIHKSPAPEWVLNLVGEHPLEIDGWLFRALGGSTGEPRMGDVMDEAAAKMAVRRGYLTLDRWMFGGQTSAVRIRRDDFPTLTVGSWITDSRTWRPNYATLERGGSVIAQVELLKDSDDGWLDLILVAGGPAAQALTAPTVGALSVDAEGRVTVPLTNVPTGADAEVIFAVATAEPATDSELWGPGGRRTGNGDILLPLAPAGATVWVKARSLEYGRRPSGFTTASSVTVTSTPRVMAVTVEVAEDGSAIVRWQRNVAMQGARIHYEAHDPDVAAALAAATDAAADDGSYTFPAGTVGAGLAFTVDVEPWTGWDGAVVTGVAGVKVRARDLSQGDAPTIESLSLEWIYPAHFAYVLAPGSEGGSSGPYPNPLQLQSVAEVGLKTNAVRIHILGGGIDSTFDTQVTPGDKRWVELYYHDQVDGDSPTLVNLEEEWPRDGTTYVVTVTPFPEWDGSAAAGPAGEPVVRNVVAPGPTPEPYSDAHPATKHYVDSAVGSAFSWGTLSITAGAVTPDFSSSKLLVLTLTEAVTMNLPSPVPGPGTYIILVRQSGGPWPITWDAGYEWPNGTAPATGSKDVYTLIVDDAGGVLVAPALSFS